ncbi:molybdopterin oxidoreductase family protein [Rhodohalobacter sp. SW132]|uniref:molybdopterin oxidoreductase family protein n=1 Tax=Rhodohalobacter sp. SW132 TaxID=2293433 RepID=UPI0018F76891|nr:nitrate reductase [Rhodohalobacter sp. SW132]
MKQKKNGTPKSDTQSKSPDSPSDEYLGFTRREFMRLASLSAAGVFTGSLMSGCGELWERQPVIDVDSWHQGVCRFCGTGCGVLIGMNDGRVVDVKGDPDAHNRGRLCIKGILNREILYADDRLHYPLIRKNGELERASWDEAMELIASRFNRAIEEKGPDSVAYYGSGQLFTEESYTANKLFKAGIGTNNVDGNPRLCMASAAVGYTSVFGKDEPMGCYEDTDHADCFFITGSNMADCHPIIWERVLDRKRANPNTTIIVVDPRKTNTAKRADLHLQIRPGTDVSLYNSMIYEFFRRGVIDEEMIEDYLRFQEGGNQITLEHFRANLENYTPEQASATCGISPEQIREAAFRFGNAPATMSFWTMGLNQQTQGTASNRLVMAMHLLTGQIGRPGATPFSLTGQPNAGGGIRDTGALAHALPTGRAVANPDHRREMEELWNVPEGRISPNPGYHTMALFQAMHAGDVDCTLIMSTNPIHSLPNILPYREAMERTFVVVADAFHPTETTKYADVVLPAAMWVEKSGVFSQSERRYHYVPKLAEPQGEARSDFDILIDLADRLGHSDLFPNRTQEDIWNEWRKISGQSYYNFEGITYERLKNQPGILWPCPDEDHPGTCRRFVPGSDPMVRNEDARLDFYARPDGRAIIYLHEQEPPYEPTDEEYPLTLTTGRVLEHWHTETITRGIEDLKSVDTDFLEVHPADAQRYGLSEGDMVNVYSRRGDADFVTRITNNIREGLVFATMHSAKHLVNKITSDAVDPFSRQPDYKRCAVNIEKASVQA